MKSEKPSSDKFKIYLSLFLISCVVLVIALASCNNSEKSTDISSSDLLVSDSQQEKQPVDVSLSDVEMTIGVNTIHCLTADGGETIVWRSSDDNIASIDATGNITGVSVGKCDITAENEFGRSAQCHVDVRKTIFLTFDDGPLNECENVLKVLKKYDVKATFFVVDTYNLAITKRMYEEGHMVGLHSFSHSFPKCYRSEYSYYAGLEQLNDNIEAFTGKRSDIIRFPGGSDNTVMEPLGMRRMVSGIDDLGYRAFDWTVSARDASKEQLSSDAIAKNVKRGCYHDYEIVLMHEKKTTAEALEKSIPSLLRKGYLFETLDHCAEHSHISTTWYEKSVSKKAVPCQEVSFTVFVDRVNVDESTTVNAKMSPDNTTDYLRFVSDDPSVAKVTLDGIVTGISKGNTTIRAISSSGKEAVLSVTIE